MPEHTWCNTVVQDLFDSAFHFNLSWVQEVFASIYVVQVNLGTECDSGTQSQIDLFLAS